MNSIDYIASDESNNSFEKFEKIYLNAVFVHLTFLYFNFKIRKLAF